MCRAVECIHVASKDFVPGAAGEFTNQVRGTGPVAPLPKKKGPNLGRLEPCGIGAVVAGSTGLEPVASGVTGRRYNRLN